MSTAPKFKSYQDAVDWLFIQLPNYQKEGLKAYKPGLETILALLLALDHPQNKFKAIHIAGTNGKGSVAHLLASAYQEGGYKVGIFTSPHITDFRERVKINGQYVSEQKVLDFVNKNVLIIKELNATFFEITTALAFQAFADEKVDVAIIETGLGGRLDSTNVIDPLVAVITNIGLDHQQFLGDTLELIAAEKGGIIKSKRPVVIGKRQTETLPIFEEIAEQKNALLVKAVACDYPSDLLGGFQKENVSTAFTTIEVLQSSLPIKQRFVKAGFLKVAENTNFKGRFQKLSDQPLTILDAAHNVDGVSNLMKEIKNLDFEHLHLVYGASNDKNVREILELLPNDASYYFVEFDSPRSMKIEQFSELAERLSLPYSVHVGAKAALDKATKKASNKDLILLFGSFYIMSELI